MKRRLTDDQAREMREGALWYKRNSNDNRVKGLAHDVRMLLIERRALLAEQEMIVAEAAKRIQRMSDELYDTHRAANRAEVQMRPLVEALAEMKISLHGGPLYDDSQQLQRLIDVRKQARALVAQWQTPTETPTAIETPDSVEGETP